MATTVRNSDAWIRRQRRETPMHLRTTAHMFHSFVLSHAALFVCTSCSNDLQCSSEQLCLVGSAQSPDVVVRLIPILVL